MRPREWPDGTRDLRYVASDETVTPAEWSAHARNAEREARKLAARDEGLPDDPRCRFCRHLASSHTYEASADPVCAVRRLSWREMP